MITTAIILIISGIFTAISEVRKSHSSITFIAAYILGVGTLILSKDYFSDQTNSNPTLALLLIAVLSVNFALGEFLKNKRQLILVLIPVLLSGVFIIYPELAHHNYMGHSIDDVNTLILVSLIAALAPILIHGANLLIKKLVDSLSPLKWTSKDAQLLHGAFNFAFIGITAAIGSFLLGTLGILIVAVFFLSATFISRDKSTVPSSILISVSSAFLMISAAFLVLENAGFTSLDLTKGEVLQGVFMAGFIALVYEILIRMAQNSEGKWRFLFLAKAIFVPLLMLFLLGFAYTQLERLGGVLTLAAILISLGIISLVYSTIKLASNGVALKLFSLGFVIIIAPYFSPIQQSSGIDLDALGIEKNKDKNAKPSKAKSYHEKLDEPDGQALDIAVGTWTINEEVSKVFFELGPANGRVKGEFPVIKGKFHVTEDIEKTKINVIIPAKEISTYNSMRDESLLEEDFLHVEKYPEISFQSAEFSPQNDGYKVNGKFTLMGITQDMILTLKLVGIGEQDGKEVMVIWGKASLDRTDYGMPSSAKLGDVVDFHFEVQLNK